jgi:type IV pilus assembly protein PilN
MIRINLLQVRATRERKRSSVATQLLVFLLVLGGEIGAFVYLQLSVSKQVSAKNDEIQQIQTQLNAKRSQMSDLDAKKKELEDINAKRAVIEALQVARTGPKNMVAELMRILSKNGGPTMDDTTRRLVNQNPEMNFHRDWDFRRLWVSKFLELDREVTIEGTAMDVEDIGEFQRRLNLSQYFDDVRWVSSPEATGGTEGEESLYKFTLKGRAVYR